MCQPALACADIVNSCRTEEVTEISGIFRKVDMVMAVPREKAICPEIKPRFGGKFNLTVTRDRDCLLYGNNL